MGMASGEPSHCPESLVQHCNREIRGPLQYIYACGVLVNMFLQDCTYKSCKVHSYDCRMSYSTVGVYCEGVSGVGVGWSTSVRSECIVTHRCKVVKEKSVLDMSVPLGVCTRRRVR